MAKRLKTEKMTEPPRDDTLSTSGQTSSHTHVSNDVIIKLADAISFNGHFLRLSLQLGVQMHDMSRALETNQTAGTKTRNGYVMMLKNSKKTVKLSKRLPFLKAALMETYLPIKEYDPSEDRKSSMNSNTGNWRPEFVNVLSEVRSIQFQFEGQQRLEMIHDTKLLRTNVGGSKVAAPVISTYSRLDDLFLLRIDNSVDKSVRKSVNFLSLVLKGHTKSFNSAGQPTLDNSYYYRTESMHGSKTLQDEGLQKADKLYSHSFNDSTLPPVDGTQWINFFLQNALHTLIQISMLLKIARQYRHVVIVMVILTQAACEDVQVPINCTSAAVITSQNYPSTYPPFESTDWFVTAPKGIMILLTFNDFSLGSSGDVTVIETVTGRKRQRYGGEDNTFPPFVSRKNSLLLRFRSDGKPTRSGFNISASCYESSGTRVGRLVGGNTPAEGFLELRAESGGEWMGVCEENSADRLAEVVCGELGFPGAKEVSYKQGGCSSEGADPGCIRAHSCENYVYRSQDCSASSDKCNSSLAVRVKCFEPGFKGCFDLRNTQLQNGYSYNSTSQCITSCRADTSKALAIINGSKCFCSTSDYIGLDSFSQVETQSCTLLQLVYNASDGYCDQPHDVMNGTWDSNSTWFGSIVHLECNDGYRLNGNGTLQCVTKVSSYLLVWNGSIPTCKRITKQHVNTSRPMTDGQINAAIAISSSTTALLICIICAVVRRRKIHKQCAAPPTTAAGESDQTNLTRALPQTPNDESQPNILLNRSQHLTQTPQNLNNSSTLLPSLELTDLQHENNDYASGNPYHYAISVTHPPQLNPNTGNPVNAYELEDMTDQNTIDAEHRTQMMFNRPLPHRPISFGVREGPSLPPRERHVIHSSTLAPNLVQNTSSDNPHLGACSLTYNSLTNGEQGVTVDRMPRNSANTKEVVVLYPCKGTTLNKNVHHGYYSADHFEHDEVHKGGECPLSPSKLDPFYHCLEDYDQQICSDHCDTDVLINNESNAHDDNVVMVENVLYNPMDC